DSGMNIMLNVVDLKYFETTGIRLIAGRDFSPSDRENTPGVVIVNEGLARQVWPGENALGKRIRYSGDKDWRQIIGVAADTKFFDLKENNPPCMSQPLSQQYIPVMTLLALTTGEPRPVEGLIRSEVQRIEPNVALSGIGTVEEMIARSLWAQRMIAEML